MLYEEFVEAVERKMMEVVDDNFVISTFTAEKNNGVTRQGIVIKEEHLDISPTIYLEEYYERYRKGWTVQMIVYDILQLYEEVRVQKKWDHKTFESFDNIAGKIVYHLVNREKNKELLRVIPHCEFMDLAIVFCLVMEITERGIQDLLHRPSGCPQAEKRGSRRHRCQNRAACQYAPAGIRDAPRHSGSRHPRSQASPFPCSERCPHRP